MRRNISDPSWKSGPTHPEPTASEHAIYEEDFGHNFDFDGFGVDEADSVEGAELIVIQERVQCNRDGCDAAHARRLLFTTYTLSSAEKYALDIVSGLDSPAAYAWDRAERVGPQTIEVDGTQIEAERVIEDEADGPCHGRVEPHTERY